MENTKLMPWEAREKAQWLTEQKIQRSYKEEVVSKIEALKSIFDVTQYGALSYDVNRYPVFMIKTNFFSPNKKTILITGGVHGYETSGVQGALSFMSHYALKFSEQFNIVCFPCISPWGYETINRWNQLAIDPNRSFMANSSAEESRLFVEAMKDLKKDIFMHIDLHETTDTDNSIFRPAKASRDGKEEEFSEIPDGFYLVGDSSKPEKEFQRAIIETVRKVTHIAPADSAGKIIGVPLEQEGVINYDKKKLFLCGGFTDARYVTTTEVYPHSPTASDIVCIEAQVAAIKGGLDFLKKTLSK
jgi:hypothetical protein